MTKQNRKKNCIDWNKTLEEMREDTEGNRRVISPPIPQYIPHGDTRYPSRGDYILRPNQEQERIRNIMNEIISLSPPEGSGNGMVIIDDQMYSETSRGESFAKVTHCFVHLMLEKDVIFVAEGCSIRFTIKEGKIIAVELLKGFPDARLENIKKAMREKCGKTIFFRSKVEGS